MADPTCLALCAGIGGLEMGVRRALGCRVVGYVERDAYAAAVLLARMEDAALEPAPVWCGNLEDLDTSPFLGVDIVTAGFPCQPWSVAGKRQGIADERWIWPAIVRIIGDVGPRLVFLENVPGLLAGGVAGVLGDLASLGYDAEWDLVRASDVEAPQRRERWFCLAHGNGGRQLQPIRGEPDERGRPSHGGEGVARGSEQDTDQGQPWPPGPQDLDGWAAYLRSGGPEPCLRGGSTRIPDRMDRLRCLGNSVVPAQSELAFRILYERMTQ